MLWTCHVFQFAAAKVIRYSLPSDFLAVLLYPENKFLVLLPLEADEKIEVLKHDRWYYFG